MIDINGLTLKFNNECVFENVDLQINDGDYLVIVGENGSGKTTLINALLGIKKIDQGEIKIDGIDVNSFHDWQKFGYVPQKYNITNDVPITVWEYLNLYSSNKKEIKKRMKEFRLEGIKDHVINKLSGGQFQRVNIAKSLLNKIEYLILDEPNTGLDIDSRNELYSTLHKLNSKGLTIIIISHTYSDFANKIHKIYDLKNKDLKEVTKDDCEYC